jgi:chromate transporter
VVVGLGRAGWRGGLAAWLGFTAPSALLMFAFGLAAPRLDGPWATAVLHGLKLTAAAIVAQATWSMARRLTPDLTRLAIAGATGVLSLALGGAVAQLGLLAGAAGVGLVVCRSAGPIGAPPTLPIGGRAATLALVVFLAVLAALPLVATAQARGPVALAAAIYQAGALVFGGGHVVLPLLRMALVPHGWLTDSRFLAGYGAAQALPGPLFAFAAFLGESAAPAGSTLAVKAAWAVVALVAIFVPGVLLVVAGAPIWTAVARHPSAQGALSGVNAAVVGILAAALYTPIGTSAITTPADAAIVVAGFSLLVILKSPPLAIVGFCVGMAVALRGLTGAL